jgi:GNAT superfamily N-acetyltransferase
MYAWLTRSGQLDESTVHTVSIFANDQPAIAAWSSLGFGVHHIDAARTTRSSDANNDQVRAAIPADLFALSILSQKVYDHLSQPPVHLPVHESEFDEAKFPGARSHTSVAEVDGQIVGYMSCQLGAQEAMTLRNDAIPQINGAYLEPEYRGGTLARDMLNDLLAWARTKSASHITTDFETANVEGANFWLHSGGFKPVLTSLVRRLPESH